MSNEDAVLKEMLKHLKEASRRIQASRHLMQEHTLVEDRDYLRLVARLSEALDVTEAAHREAPEAPETVGEGREGTGLSLAEAPRRAPRNRGGVGTSGSNREKSDVVEILRKISEANSMTVSEAAAFLDGP